MIRKVTRPAGIRRGIVKPASFSRTVTVVPRAAAAASAAGADGPADAIADVAATRAPPPPATRADRRVTLELSRDMAFLSTVRGTPGRGTAAGGIGGQPVRLGSGSVTSTARSSSRMRR